MNKGSGMKPMLIDLKCQGSTLQVRKNKMKLFPSIQMGFQH